MTSTLVECLFPGGEADYSAYIDFTMTGRLPGVRDVTLGREAAALLWQAREPNSLKYFDR